MKSKRSLFVSLFQLIVGIIAIVVYVFLGLSGENIVKWSITVILAIAYVILGVMGILEYKNNKWGNEYEKSNYV